ncbi:hypothetical protein HUJ04_011208, partial [Dendroctonus ponderosae]
SNCNNSYQKNEHLVQHLQQEYHLLFDEPEEIVFTSNSDFQNWKTKYEEENKCNYTVARTWGSNEGKVIYYNCNRTKTGKPSSQQRVRQLKSQASCKLDSACTSVLKLRHNENKLYVHIQKTHYGHNLDLQHLRISNHDKGLIASKLIAGVTKTTIVDSTRDKSQDSLQRIDLLTFMDVDNIKRSYNIETGDGIRHNNDVISVDLWVQECQALPADKNPILISKKRVTHLITLEKRISASLVFFESIRQKVGIITAKTFMSDITETFYSVWLQVMGPVTYRHFCSWHIDRAWQINLSKIANKEKRAKVYHTLKVLQEELNKHVFENQLLTVAKLMIDDKDTRNFGEYFKTSYHSMQWAYCYR